ncbi:MAG: hypothetical protein FJX77_17290, partial [Armatimonadetes bacterium]|nr:hypothetical protein [Armatimonadota bacterium]
MRSPFLRALLGLGAALLVLPALAGPLPTPPDHSVTTRSERAAREYQKGLRQLHEGRAGDAARTLEGVLRRDETCALAAWCLSRAYARLGRMADARETAERAEDLAAAADDREQQLIRAWSRHLKSVSGSEADRTRIGTEIRRDLDRLIALYPHDPEVWILRGELSETPLRGGPFFLAAIQLQREHPLARTWKPTIPPLPELQPVEGAPVAAPAIPVKLFDGLGNLTHPITTKNPEAQKFYEQGLRCF